MIVLDTSGIIAAYNRREPAFEASHQLLTSTDQPIVLSPLVLAEVDYLADKYLGTSAAVTLLRELERIATVASFANADLRDATDLVERYADLRIGLTDAVNVVLAGRYKTTRLLTLDDHYRVIRPLHGAAFDMLPARPR